MTTINAPSEPLRALASGAADHGFDLIIVGDASSPADFKLDGADYLDLAAQARLPFRYAALCPIGSYARKNIGYLAALAHGAPMIVETDDDNRPVELFWRERARSCLAHVVRQPGWLNAYAFFTDGRIWPRGLPLNAVKRPVPARDQLEARCVDAPIQQALADGDPDVDAIYRLVQQLPFTFSPGDPIALGSGVWCPFNSQNTTWWRKAALLLYLPATCSMRMTDIWRSLVAQRIAWTCGWRIVFHPATMIQIRNAHDLMRDFRDELPGYLHNESIAEDLANLPLAGGAAHLAANLARCYERLVEKGHLDRSELPLLTAWVEDVAELA